MLSLMVIPHKFFDNFCIACESKLSMPCKQVQVGVNVRPLISMTIKVDVVNQKPLLNIQRPALQRFHLEIAEWGMLRSFACWAVYSVWVFIPQTIRMVFTWTSCHIDLTSNGLRTRRFKPSTQLSLCGNDSNVFPRIAKKSILMPRNKYAQTPYAHYEFRHCRHYPKY